MSSMILGQIKQKGFTIVELVIVIAVIGILATIVVVGYGGWKKTTLVAQVKSDLNGVASAMESARNFGTGYPATTATIFTPSDGVTLTGGSTDGGKTYCIDATVASDNSVVFYLASETKDKGALEGTCATAGCSTGFIVVPGNSLFGTSTFCTMKYEAKNDGSGNAVSTAAGTPWVSISQTTAISTANAACSGCHLISEAEWLTIVHNVLSVPSNWSSGTVGTGYIFSGHNDGAPNNSLAADTNDANGYAGETNTGGNQRRTLTLTNGEVIWDLAGNVWEWTTGTTTGNQPGASGFAWREWNTVAGTGNLTPNPFPSFGTPAASSWNSAQGIGQLYSSSTDTSLRGFNRGGNLSFGGYTGVLTLALDEVPSAAGTLLGFRVSR